MKNITISSHKMVSIPATTTTGQLRYLAVMIANYHITLTEESKKKILEGDGKYTSMLLGKIENAIETKQIKKREQAKDFSLVRSTMLNLKPTTVKPESKKKGRPRKSA